MNNKACAFCGNSKKKEILVKVSQGYNYIICNQCKGGVLHPFVGEKGVAKLYESKNYHTDLSKPVKNRVRQWIITRRFYELPEEWVFRNFNKGSVLDVGCGNGEYLEYLQQKGFEVAGCDISSVAIKNTGNKIGKKNVKKGNFLKLNFNKKYDVISFWHVLEHVDQPEKYLEKAKETLKKDGFVVGEVPNAESYVFKLFNEYYSWIMVPEHLLYFSQQSLSVVLARTGFSNIYIYSPKRALTNLSSSLGNLISAKVHPKIGEVLAVLFIPLSVVFVMLSSYFKRGEVIRFKGRV
jgi:2-polyprenyl-3-methyl-5-hydroxy-6-metoxy-1,4-benzoquinol methylase